jgi:hypothetical protein
MINNPRFEGWIEAAAGAAQQAMAENYAMAAANQAWSDRQREIVAAQASGASGGSAAPIVVTPPAVNLAVYIDSDEIGHRIEQRAGSQF